MTEPVTKEREQLATMRQALEALEDVDGINTETECVTIDVGEAITALRTAIEKLETAEFHSAEYWKGHDDAVRGVAMRWEEALTAPIPKAGVMSEPLEFLYRRTEALRTALEQAETAQGQESRSDVEPVAWMDREGDVYKQEPPQNWCPPHTPLYTVPPAAQRQWVGLDADEKLRVRLAVGYSQFMTAGEYAEKVQDATEAKLREKNGGQA